MVNPKRWILPANVSQAIRTTMGLIPDSSKIPPTEEKTEAKKEGQANMLLMLSEFSQETSLHGVKFILRGCTSSSRRIFWSAVILVEIVLFVAVMVTQMTHVSKHPIVTKVITQYVDKLPFPAVTLCSHSPGAKHSHLSPFQKEVLFNIGHANTTYFGNISAEEYESINLVEIYKTLLLSAEDVVDRCWFGNIDCMKYIKKTWGKQTLCYTINSALPDELCDTNGNMSLCNNDKTHGLVSRVPGARMGLRLHLNVAGFYSGIKVLVHHPTEKITMSNSEFLQLSPETTNYIGIKFKRNKFLPPPYMAFGDKVCIETSPDYQHPLVRTGSYTLRACHDACDWNFTKHRCGCTVEMDYNEHICDPITFIDCVLTNPEKATNCSYGNPYTCDCPFPCEDIEYDTTLSSGRFARPDSIFINVHYDRLRIESTEQVEDYTTEDVFASLGGQMGLFLGASVITVIELVELLTRCVWRWLEERYNTLFGLKLK